MHSERGMSLIEALIASTVTMLVVGGVLSMLTSMQVIHVDLASRNSSRQAARMAMSWIQRDLIKAGVGLTPMMPVFPLVAPRNGGGLTVRYNSEAITELIQQDTTNRNTVVVPSTFGGRVGDYVLIYDSTGGFDLTLIEQYAPGAMGMTVGPDLSRNYLASDGTAISRVEQIEYWLDGSKLMRTVDNDQPELIAEAVVAFQIRYFDDQIPPVEFTPATAAAQMRIRVVEILIQTETDADLVQTGDRPAIQMRSRVSPRALSIARS